MTPDPDERFTAADLDACLRVLDALVDDPARFAALEPERRRRLLTAAGRLSRPDAHEWRRRAKALRKLEHREKKAHDAAVLARTELRTVRREPVFVPPPARPALPAPAAAPELGEELLRPRSCYVCKVPFSRLHHFYDQMCPPCAELNYAKRFQTAPLDGRVALVTGARIKIGFHIALKLLRAGARVVATTRFPHDAALRYAREEDYAAWRDRLEIHGLDLRHAPSVELFARWLADSQGRLDLLVNNAAQTVRRPTAFYAHLLPGEERPVAELPPAAQPLLRAHEELKAAAGGALLVPARAAQLRFGPDEEHPAELFPMGQVDCDLQQVDLRTVNSWRLGAADVPTVELLEVHLVNAIAPFLLVSRLRPLMARDRTDEKHVVNVSAMEAQFSRKKKTDKHPHTNMAKAALNMLTRTSAADWAQDGIWMNSVDTGWITDEDPMHHVVRKQREHDFSPPLDVVDGAARVCDPFFSGLLTGQHPWGKFFKDYKPTGW